MSSTSGSIGRSTASQAVTAPTEPTTPVRVVALTPGQQVQATVVEVAERGRVVIGLLGGRVAAFSRLPLELGKSYEFTVAAVHPKIVLSTAKPLLLPDFAGAAIRGRLGPAPAALDAWLRTATAALGHDQVLTRAGAEAAASPGGSSDADRSVAGGSFWSADPVALADGLRNLQRQLGHDLEARVLRLLDAPAGRLVELGAELRDTLKSRAIAVLERAATGDASGRDETDSLRALRDLVQGLGAIEVDNARRAEQGGATWLPLPTSAADRELRDARMFLLHSDADASDGGPSGLGERAFTIVLLLDLTRLGALRVDIGVRGARLTIDVETVEPGAAAAVRSELGQLGQNLERLGLGVERMAVRVAPGRQLPIADLCSPQSRSETSGDNLVDVHA